MARVIIEVEGDRTEFEMGLAQIIKLTRMAYELQDGKEPGIRREVVYVPYCVPVPSPLNPPYEFTCGSTVPRVSVESTP